MARRRETTQIAMAHQAAEPPHRWHGHRAGDLKAGHDPMNSAHIAIERMHDVRQSDRYGEHAKSHGHLTQEDRQGENPAGRMRRLWTSARRFGGYGGIVPFILV